MNLAELIAHQRQELHVETVAELARRSQTCAMTVSKPTLSRMANPDEPPWMPTPHSLAALALVLEVNPLVVWTALCVSHKQAPPSATVIALRELSQSSEPSMVAEGPVSEQGTAWSLQAALEVIERSTAGGRHGQQRALRETLKRKARRVPNPRPAGAGETTAPASAATGPTE